MFEPETLQIKKKKKLQLSSWTKKRYHPLPQEFWMPGAVFVSFNTCRGCQMLFLNYILESLKLSVDTSFVLLNTIISKNLAACNF